MLKEQLLKEAQDIDAFVELDGIFESVDLSENVKEDLATVFSTVVKKQAVELAESHIKAISDRADELVKESVDEEVAKHKEAFKETADKFFENVASEWLEDNKLAVDNTIKAGMFESMALSLKNIFVEHNVSIPEESIDVVAEMEQEIEDAKAEAGKMFESLTSVKEELNTLKRDSLVKESIQDLTESQKEKVQELIEGLSYGDKFESKLTAIVNMAKSSVTNSKESLNESTLNNNNKQDVDPAGLDFKVEPVEKVNESTKQPLADDMSAFVAAAKRLV